MDFEEIDCIGRGTNCEVFRCRRREDGCTYAMKRVIRPVKGPASKAPAMKEVFALSALSTLMENAKSIMQLSKSICCNQSILLTAGVAAIS